MRFYANGHNRRRPRIFPKYRGIARDVDKDKLEEVVEIQASLLDRFIGANTTVPQYVLILQQEKYIKELSEVQDDLSWKYFRLKYFIRSNLLKYIPKDTVEIEDERILVKIAGKAARGTIISEERFDNIYGSDTLDKPVEED